MKPLPRAEQTLLLRTDFSNENVWREICSAVRVPAPEIQEASGMFAAAIEATVQWLGKSETSVHIVDDPDYRDATTEQLLELLGDGYNPILMFVVDGIAMSHPDHPILVVDLCGEPGRTFRTVPSQIFWIESNLSIANMDWEDFTGAIDDEGVFRGFPE